MQAGDPKSLAGQLAVDEAAWRADGAVAISLPGQSDGTAEVREPEGKFARHV